MLSLAFDMCALRQINAHLPEIWNSRGGEVVDYGLLIFDAHGAVVV
jgi:hypothetical protein